MRLNLGLRLGPRNSSGTPTPAPAVIAPVNNTAPVVTGTAQEGQTLTTGNGNWANSPTSFAYRWNRGGVAIAGATAQTYLLVSADVGSAMTSTVTATNSGGSASSTSAPTATVTAATVAPPVNSTLPTISGTAQEGSTLTLTRGTYTNSPTSYAQQWKRGGVDIASATALTYLLVAADVGATITVTETATNAGGSTAATSAATAAVAAAPVAAPVFSAAPVITGTATEGQTLTTTTGTASNSPTYALQWKRGGVAISGATATTYLLVAADVGTTITVTSTATNAGGSASSTSAATAVVAAAPAAFTPASLTTSAWYDPSDMASLFQDSAGTVAVTATGQPVGRMNDKSGNARHLLQATAASRPIFTIASGLSYLQFDGVDDGMASAATVFPASVDAFFAINNAANDLSYVTCLDPGDAGNRYIGVAASGSGAVTYAAASGPVTDVVNGVAVATPTTRDLLYTAIGSTAGKVYEGQAAMLGTWTVLAIANFGGFEFSGRHYGIVVAPVLSAANRAQVRTYLGAKAGIVL